MTEIKRKHIIFYGSVQGVGFRYRARQAADMVGCIGWVRNEWDGSVRKVDLPVGKSLKRLKAGAGSPELSSGADMEIQGTESEIDQVIMAVERGHYVRIENMEVKDLEPVERR